MSATVKERLAAARERKASREAEEQAKAEERELEILEAEEKYGAELGRRGQSWELIPCNDEEEPFVVVKLGMAVLYKRFQAEIAPPKDVTPEACQAFVTPCVVHPSRERFQALLERRLGFVLLVTNALRLMYEGKEASDAGKA